MSCGGGVEARFQGDRGRAEGEEWQRVRGHRERSTLWIYVWRRQVGEGGEETNYMNPSEVLASDT
jgi:hypothetical protein